MVDQPRQLFRIALVAICFALAAATISSVVFAPPVFADDGGDGGDGDGGGDDGGADGGGAGGGSDAGPSGNGWAERQFRRSTRSRRGRYRCRCQLLVVCSCRRVGRRAKPTRRARNRTRGQGTAAATPRTSRDREIVATSISAEALETLSAQGFEVRGDRQSGLLGTRVVRLGVPAAWGYRRILRAINATSPGTRVANNDIYRRTPLQFFETEGASCGTQCPAFELTKWTEAAGRCSAGVRIGVIDTGVDPDHNALKDANLTLFSTRRKDRPASSKDHGTAVVSLLAGQPTSSVPGLAPQAQIFAVDAFYRAGKSSRADAFDLVAGLDWLVEQGAQTINLSLSGRPNVFLEEAVGRIIATGTVIVAAAGRRASKRDDRGYPAKYDGVIAVSAVDTRLRPSRLSIKGAHIAFSAPGVGIIAARAGGGLAKVDGTSFAAPFVAAAFAAGQGPRNERAGEILKLLRQGAVDLGAPGPDPVHGWGLIQYEGLPKC